MDVSACVLSRAVFGWNSLFTCGHTIPYCIRCLSNSRNEGSRWGGALCCMMANMQPVRYSNRNQLLCSLFYVSSYTIDPISWSRHSTIRPRKHPQSSRMRNEANFLSFSIGTLLSAVSFWARRATKGHQINNVKPFVKVLRSDPPI